MCIFEDIDKELSSKKYRDWFCLLSKYDNCITSPFYKAEVEFSHSECNFSVSLQDPYFCGHGPPNVSHI